MSNRKRKHSDSSDSSDSMPDLFDFIEQLTTIAKRTEQNEMIKVKYLADFVHVT